MLVTMALRKIAYMAAVCIQEWTERRGRQYRNARPDVRLGVLQIKDRLRLRRLWHEHSINDVGFDFASALRQVVTVARAERVGGIKAN